MAATDGTWGVVTSLNILLYTVETSLNYNY